MSPPTLKILISGGGIAGHCLAYWLSRTPLAPTITILERATVPRVTGQAVDIHPPSVEIVRKMGLLDSVRAFNTTEEGTTLRKPDGKPFLHLHTKDGFSFTNEYEILRADLATLFHDAAAKFPNVECIYGAHVTSLTQTDDSCKVTLSDNTTHTYDLVVAADGSASKLRNMILPTSVTDDSYTFIGQYNAFFSIPSLPSDDKMWHFMNLPHGRALMLRPHRTPETMGAYLCVTTPGHSQRDERIERALDAGPEATKALLREYFVDSGWQAERILEGMDTAKDFYVSRAATVKLEQWTAGRACVVGDAAWATFGIGTTLAIVGAYHLAGEIGKIQGSEGVQGALEAYEKGLRPTFKAMWELPPGYPQMLFPQSKMGLRVRDSALWLVSKSRFLFKLLGDEGQTEGKFKLPEYEWVDL